MLATTVILGLGRLDTASGRFEQEPRQGPWVTVAMENVYKIKMVELPKYTEYKAELL